MTLRRSCYLSSALLAVIVISACAPSTQVASNPPPARSPAITPSATPSPARQASSPRPQAERMMVAGSTLEFSADLAAGWESFGFGAGRETPPTSFFVSRIDNTFEDPCTHVLRDPKVGSTAEAVVTALLEIPHATATEPAEATVAGHDATYLELAFPASMPCEPGEFYLWQDSPGAYWWLQQVRETTRIWVLDVEGQPIVVAAHTYPNTSEEAQSELDQILDSIVFDGG